ncbi:pyridoxal-phosphate dependent enzyme [Kitasatospora sp. NPDC048239]|uniref:pyridoxal-phosphate dependent enzyme n=1 Tax=unclassified Kitasatospora TaxID=2633591 RepID=UPI00371BE619
MFFRQHLERFETLLGLTPIRTVTIDVLGRPRRIHLKLEGQNLTGSVKGRTAYGLVRGLAEDGLLRPGVELLESTSGNLGVALASMARYLGVGFSAVVDPMITAECRQRLAELGATVITVDRPDPAGGYLLSRLAAVRELVATDDRYVWANQYENPRNPEIHRTMTGPEILGQLPEPPDALFAAISTGGTFAGLAQHFREHSPRTRLVAVDINGSVAVGGPPGTRHLSGIGASRRSSFLEPDMIDQVAYASIAEAAYYCRLVLQESGIHLGGSSGAVLAACVRYLADHPETAEPLCVCADGGEKYQSTIYNDEWLESIGQPADLPGVHRTRTAATVR